MKRLKRPAAGGFTLIELLLVLALVGLFAGIFVLNIGSLLRDGELESLERQYWRAVDAARTGAVFEQHAHFVQWDPEGLRFLVKSAAGEAAFPVDSESLGEAEVEVFFEEFAPENSYVLIAGKLVAKRKIVSAGFFPDGTCSPFAVTLKIAGFETHFQMDPWTGVQLVNPNKDESSI